jgi:hypothetical protein
MKIIISLHLYIKNISNSVSDGLKSAGDFITRNLESLANDIAKLFGLGGSSSPKPQPVTYQFQMNGSMPNTFGQGLDGYYGGGGLNEVAHIGEQNRSLLSRFKKDANGKYIVNPFGKPDFSDAGIRKIMAAVDGLERDYIIGGKPKVDFDLNNGDAGGTNPGKVSLDPTRIKSNYQYATVLFHEYRHAWQYFKGKFGKWGTEYGYKAVWDIMERDAYWYQIQVGAGDSYEGYYRYESYRKLTSYVKLPY